MNGTFSLILELCGNKALLFKLYTSTTVIYLPEQGLIRPLTSLQCGTMLQSLTNTKSYAKCLQLHGHMVTCGTLVQNTYLNTKLAACYVSCGRMAEAQVIFDQVVFKSSFLWNFMIRGYSCDGNAFRSLVLYRQMFNVGRKPDNFTYPYVLKACGDLLLNEIGRRVHALVLITGLASDIYVGNSLLSMYSKFGYIATARMLFDNMPVRDLTSWNTVISGYVKNGKASDAFILFDQMKNAGFRGDETTLLALLCGCGALKNLKAGRAIHGHVVRNSGTLCNKFLINSLIDMYCNCDSISDARKLFEELTMKDTVSWNSLISGYERHGYAFETLKLFCQMIMEDEVPDEATIISMLGACNQISALLLGSSIHSYIVKNGFGANTAVSTALINMYTKCGSLPSAHCAFDEMPERNLASWTVMVTGYGIHGRGKEAISIFYEMLGKNIIPDEGMFTSVLSACSHSGLVDKGKEIFYKVMREYNVEPKEAHYACLVDLLGRAGNLDEAYAIINAMKVEPNYDIWNSLLSACKLYHNVKLAEISAQKLFEMNSKGVGSYVCLSNIYAAERRWNDVDKVRALVRRRRLRKPPSNSFVTLNETVRQILAGDISHQ